MADLKAVQSHSSMNIENLTSIPVEGSLTLKNCAHRQPPDRSTKDRGWAWVVCAGSFSVMFIVYGIHTSFGVLLVALLHHFNASKANTAWIGSISVNLLYFFSPVTSSLANRYGVRVVTIAGGLLMSVGLFLSSYATSLLFLYISYGLLLGIGTSLCATMALIVSADYFDKHLSLATGIVASGSSFGTLTVAPTLQILIQHLGWQTTLRIMGLGGIILALTGLVYRPVQRIPVHVENKKQCFDITILKNKGFVVWTLATTIAGFGYYIPHFFLVRYSEDLGIPLSRGSWLISFFGISSAIGRVLFGRASDMFRCPILLIYRTCMFFSGLASIFCPLVNSYAGLVAYVLVLGFLDGSYIGLMPIVTLDIVGLDDIAPAWGILYFCHSFTYLLGPPAAGLMYDSLNTFKPVFYLAAGPMIVGAFLTFFASPCKPDRMRTALTFHDDVTTHMVSPATQCHGVNRCPQHRRPPRIILTAPDESLIFLEKLTSL